MVAENYLKRMTERDYGLTPFNSWGGEVSLITGQQSIFLMMRMCEGVHVTTAQFRNGGWSEKEEFYQAFFPPTSGHQPVLDWGGRPHGLVL